MSFYFAFLISLRSKVYRTLHTERLCPTCLKILWVTVDLPIYYVTNFRYFLRWSSCYSGWFQNKPLAQKVKTSAHFTFQYSCGILSAVFCVSPYYWHPACGYCFIYSVRDESITKLLKYCRNFMFLRISLSTCFHKKTSSYQHFSCATKASLWW